MKAMIVAAALLASPVVFAQTTGPINSSQMDAASSNNDQRSAADTAQGTGQAQNAAVIKKITQDLQSAGFTDVKVVAESFVVQAKSKDGSPILMTIGPHGMSVFEAKSASGSGSGTVGVSPRPDSANPNGSGGAASGSQVPGTQK